MNTTTLPPIVASVRNCESSWVSYNNASVYWDVIDNPGNGSYSPVPARTSFTTHAYTTTSVTVAATDLTTLCDGVPRVKGEGTLTTLGVSTSISVETNVYSATSKWIPPPYPTPPPNCTFSQSLCSDVVSPTNGLLTGLCYGCALQCTIVASAVEIIYSPVPTTPFACLATATAAGTAAASTTPIFWSGNVSTSDGIIFDGNTMRKRQAANHTTQATVGYYNGIPLDLNSIYVSFEYLHATNECGDIGTPISNTIIAFNSGELATRSESALFGTTVSDYSSYIGWYSRSLNVADFNYPVPASLYLNQPDCYGVVGQSKAYCHTIVQSSYHPQLWANSKIINLNPAWASCIGWIEGFYDPPHPITTAPVVGAPTMSDPAPASTPAQPVVEPTTSAQPVVAPTTSAPAPPAAPTSVDPAPTIPATSADLGGRFSSIAANQPKPSSADPADPASVPANTPLPAQPTPTSANSPAQASSNDIGNIISSVAANQPVPSSQAAQPTSAALTPQDPGQNHPSPTSAVAGQSQPVDPAQSQQPPNPQQPGQSQQPGNPVTTAQTVRAGDPATTIGNTPLSVGSSAVVVGGSTIALPAPTPQQITPNSPSPVATVGGNTIINDPGNSVVQVGNTAIMPGAPPITISGTPVSLDPSGVLIVGGSSQTLTPQPASPTLIPIATVGSNVVNVNPADPTAVVVAPQQNPVAPSASPALVITAGGQPLTAQPVASNTALVVIGPGSTLSVGGPATTLGGQTLSAAPSGVVVNGNTQTFQNPALTQASATGAIVVVGSQTLTAVPAAGSSDVVVVGGSTLSIGGPAVTINGQVVSAAPNGGVQVGSTIAAFSALPTAASSGAVITVGSQTLTAAQLAPGTVVVAPGTTLSVGGPPATINGQVVSAAPSGGIQIGSTTAVISALPSAAPSGALITVGSQTLTAAQLSPGTVVLGPGTTLSVGGPATTINGQVVSAAPVGVQVGSSTAAISALPSAASSGAIITAGSQTLTAAQLSSGTVVLGPGTTLSVGGPAATINGQVISVASNGVQVGSTLAAFSALPTSTAKGAIVTAGSQIFTASSIAPGTVVLGPGTTLSVGGAPVTINGQVISAAPNGIIVGSSTIPYSVFPASPTSSGIVLTAGSSIVTASSLNPSTVVIGPGTTLSVGGPPITINGQVISAVPGGLRVGTSTLSYSALPLPSGSVVLAIGSQTITATPVPGSSSLVVVNGTTLTIGGSAITLSGQIISAATGGLVVGGSTTLRYTTVPASVSASATAAASGSSVSSSVNSGSGSASRTGASAAATTSKKGTGAGMACLAEKATVLMMALALGVGVIGVA